MFERAAIFSALLVLIVFCAVGLKYYETLGLEPFGARIQKLVGFN